MNLKDALKGINLTTGELYKYDINVLSKEIWEYKK